MLLISYFNSCGMSSGYLKKIGAYESKISDMEAKNKTLDAQNKLSEAQKIELTKKIKQLIADSGKPTAAEKDKDKIIAGLQNQIAEAEKTDCPKALALAKDEIKQWSEKFTLTVQRYESSIANLNDEWEQKFTLQVSISDNYAKKFETEHTLRLSSEDISAQLKSDLHKAHLFSNVKTYVIVGIVGYIVYTLVKK